MAAATLPKSFYVLCSGADFATKLSIPTAFVHIHGLQHRRQVSLHLKTEPSRRSWAVKIEKIDGVYYIADGWSEFVNDNGLVEMKLLIFYIVGDSTLHVAIFGLDSCLELPSSSSYSSRMQRVRPARTWKVVKKFKKRHLADGIITRIPKDLAEATGIAKKGEIEMEDWNGLKWAITIEELGERTFGLSGRGWKSFIRRNKLQRRTILLFEFADDAIKVVVMEREAGEAMLSRAKRGGFLPA